MFIVKNDSQAKFLAKLSCLLNLFLMLWIYFLFSHKNTVKHYTKYENILDKQKACTENFKYQSKMNLKSCINIFNQANVSLPDTLTNVFTEQDLFALLFQYKNTRLINKANSIDLYALDLPLGFIALCKKHLNQMLHECISRFQDTKHNKYVLLLKGLLDLVTAEEKMILSKTKEQENMNFMHHIKHLNANNEDFQSNQTPILNTFNSSQLSKLRSIRNFGIIKHASVESPDKSRIVKVAQDVNRKGVVKVCVTAGNVRTASLFQGGSDSRMLHFGSGRYHYVFGREKCRGATLLVAEMSENAQADVTLSTGDEFCRQKIHKNSTMRQPDFKQYWSDSSSPWNRTITLPNHNTPAYFPLGPRYEFKRVTEDEIVPSSKRELLFNFVGSLSTSPTRRQVVNTLQRLNTTADAALFRRGFMHTPGAWQADPNKGGGYLPTSKYRNILLKSILTLVPAGHNPECFRFYEALEAGSIPVVPLDEAFHRHPCKNPLRPWIDSGAPVFFIRDWSELPSILKNVSNDPGFADAMQTNGKLWYESFMQDIAFRFEATLDARIALRQQN